jgi:histidine triad (HIT) family protein
VWVRFPPSALLDSDSCLICRELRGDVVLAGGFVHEDDQVAAFHVPPLQELGNPQPYLGHLLLVTKRHVARLGDLTHAESAAVGVAATRLARALTEAGDADWVYAAVIGTGVPHFHLHLYPRYPETPRQTAWYAIDEWEGARLGGADEIVELATAVKEALSN